MNQPADGKEISRRKSSFFFGRRLRVHTSDVPSVDMGATSFQKGGGGGCVDQNCIMQICRDNFIMSLPRSCRREQEGQDKKSFASL